MIFSFDSFQPSFLLPSFGFFGLSLVLSISFFCFDVGAESLLRIYVCDALILDGPFLVLLSVLEVEAGKGKKWQGDGTIHLELIRSATRRCRQSRR